MNTMHVSRRLGLSFSRISIALFATVLAATPSYADDDMWDTGSQGNVTTPSQDFDIRTGKKFNRSSNRALLYVNEEASEPDKIPKGQQGYTNVLNPRTLRLVKRIKIDEKPHHFYKIPHQNKAYVSHFGGTSVITVIDLISNEVITKIPTGDGPRHLTLSKDGKYVWSANLDHDSVSLIDARTDKMLWTSKVTSKPNYAEPAFGYVFAANLGGSSLSVLDARTGAYKTDIPTGSKPFNVAVSCDEKLAMSSNSGSNDVSFIDTATLTEIARVSIMGPISTAQYDTKVNQRLNPRISPDCKYLWVGNHAAGTFAVLDIATRTLVGEVKSAEKGGGSDIMFFIAKGPAAGLAIGTNRYSPFATVINPKPPFNIIKRIPAGRGTHYVWLNEDSTEAYVSSRIHGSVSVYDLASLREVARKGGFKPIDQAAYVSFERKIVASTVDESGDPK